MGHLDGRVVIVTGAGRGVGRAHALLMASEGAKVVVNDFGGALAGDGTSTGPAQEVVDEITAAGGEAVANHASVSDFAAGKAMIEQAVDTFGDLHAVVNNAGILRDRMIVNMTEEEFDAVIDVHLKGTWSMVHHAANYWRAKTKAGDEVRASIVNTTSTSGIHSNVGQSNYGAAKSGIATLSIIAAKELGRYGVRVNAYAPNARTRMTEATPGLNERMNAEATGFDPWDPANNSPLVAWLCTENCKASGQVYMTYGGVIRQHLEWPRIAEAKVEGRWEIHEVAEVVGSWNCDVIESNRLSVDDYDYPG